MLNDHFIQICYARIHSPQGYSYVISDSSCWHRLQRIAHFLIDLLRILAKVHHVLLLKTSRWYIHSFDVIYGEPDSDQKHLRSCWCLPCAGCHRCTLIWQWQTGRLGFRLLLEQTKTDGFVYHAQHSTRGPSLIATAWGSHGTLPYLKHSLDNMLIPS